MKKLISVFLCAAMLICACSCSKDDGGAVVSYKSGTKTVCSLDSSFMYFWISLQKSVYTTVAAAYENGWEQVIDEQKGTTLCDLLMTESEESAKKLLVIEYLHDNVYKLKLSDAQKDSVSSQIENLISRYGSETELNTKLSQFGADKNTLSRYYELMMKQNNLYDCFYGENGKFPVSEDAKKQYFKDNYSIADHIFFNTDASGQTDTDSETLAQNKREAAKSVYDRIKNAGEDFDTLKAQYNEDSFAQSYYPKGFFVTNDSTFPAEFASAVMTMSVGDITMVETPGTGIHIIRKLPMDENLYNAYDSVLQNITDTLCAEDFAARIGEYTDNAVVNRTAMDSYDPMLIPEFALD